MTARRTAGSSSVTPRSSDRARLPRAVWPLAVAAVAAGIWAGTLDNGFALDDVPLVRDNPEIRAPGAIPGLFVRPYWPEGYGGAAAGLYRPVAVASLSLNRALTGPGARGFHAVNLLLHAAVCALVWAVARRSAPWYGTALLTALLFAVHPLHAEAVAPITGRAELLAAMGVLAAWLAHRAGRFAWAAPAYLFAVLSKENAVLAPALFWIDDRLARRRTTGRALASYAAALAIALGLRLAALGGLGTATDAAFLDNPPAFAGAGVRLATALWVQLRYAALFVWPVRLSSDYSFDAIPLVDSPADPRLALGLAWTGALAAAFVLGWRRSSRPLALGVAAWALFLLPTANLLFAGGTVMAERLTYLPSFGGTLLVGHLGAGLAARAASASARRWRTGLAVALSGAVLVALGWLAVRRAGVWRDNATLALHDVEVQPRSAKLHAGVAIVLHDRGDLDGAERAYRRAIEIYPDYAQMHYNLGQLLAGRGAADEAIEHLRRATEIAPANPAPYKSLAPLLERAGRTEEALAVWGAGARLDPADLGLRFNHARALLAAGREAEALDSLRGLEREDPAGVVGGLARGLVAELEGRPAEAAAVYRRLLALGGLSPELRARVAGLLAGVSPPEPAAGPAAP